MRGVIEGMLARMTLMVSGGSEAIIEAIYAHVVLRDLKSGDC